MPIYQAMILEDNFDAPPITLAFLAGSDGEAILRIPPLDGGLILEIWRDERLVAVIEPHGIAVAHGDLAAAAAALMEAIPR